MKSLKLRIAFGNEDFTVIASKLKKLNNHR